MTRRVRIVSDSELVRGTRVVDADTGEELLGVERIEFLEPLVPDWLIRVRIDTCVLLDVVAEMSGGEAREMRPDMDRIQLADGSPVTADHREIDPKTGMQKGYVVLTPEERARGFVRPVRRSYRHETCGTVTTMAQSIAETYAREPTFYSGTFCATCRMHRPVGPDGEFVWEGTDERVGT